MVLSAEMRLRWALRATESHGSHCREDHRRWDDPNWLAWSKIPDERGQVKLAKIQVNENPLFYW